MRQMAQNLRIRVTSDISCT